MKPQELAAALRSEAPGAHSTWHHLAALLESGALQPTQGGDPPRVGPHGMLLPSDAGNLDGVRAAWWRAVVRRERPEPPALGDPLADLAALNAVQDPGREVLSERLSAAPTLAAPPAQAMAARGWLRHHLFHTLSRLPRVDAEARLPSAALEDPPRLPAPRLDPQSDADRVQQLVSALRQGARIGIVGAAASGKSTIATAAGQTIAAPVLHGDHYTWPGAGFRYTQHTDHRTTVLSGPYITHHDALLEAVRATEGALIVEGTTVGWDPALHQELDLLVFLHLDAPTRLQRKVARDQTQRRLALRLDFAEKQFLELQDVCIALAADAEWVWHRTAVDESIPT